MAAVYQFIRLTALMLVCVCSASAQSYYFRHYQVENGLSNNTVFCSTQDKNGFMWFGTKDGLNRFDGYQFKKYDLNAVNGNRLSRAEIWSLFTDEQNRIWIGSQIGLFRFDVQTETVVPFIDTLRNITEVYVEGSKCIWFISGMTLHRYDFFSRKLKTFPFSNYFAATTLCQTPDGTMWFATVDGYLIKWRRESETFIKYNVFEHSPKAASQWIEKIYVAGNDSIFVGTSSQGLKLFHCNTGSYEDVLTYNANKTTIFVRDIVRYSDSEYWCATESGIFTYNTHTKAVSHFEKNYQDPYAISDNAVYAVYRDKEGGIWSGTYFGGINYYPKQYAPFKKFFPDNTQNAISGNVVREICEDQYGNLWLGTEDAGLNKLNPVTGLITHFIPTGDKSSIAYSNIHGLAPAGNELWVGTFEHGLDILDIKTGKVVRHYIAGPSDDELKSNFVVSLLRCRDNSMYVGTSNGLYLYNPLTDGFKRFSNEEAGVFIASLLEDHSGTIWIGTHDMGVFSFNPATGAQKHFVNDRNNKNSLSTNTVNAIYEDRRKNIWFCTEGGGLCRLDSARQTFTRYTSADGLPSNFVFKILEDDKGIFWVTTSKGMISFDFGSNKKVVYTKGNGLLNDQFNYNSGYKTAKGNIYFGSVKGMIEFNPDDFSRNEFTAPLYITGFQVHNKELAVHPDSGSLKKSIAFTNKIILPYDQSSFSIDFASLGYSSPERTEYRYMMQGLDKDWTYIATNRKVYFTNLSPGSYTFKVRASNNGSNSTEKSLEIKILPPWWATIWAYILYTAVALGVIYYLVVSYHQHLEDKKEKEIYEAKIDFFTNLAHEIRTPLTLIKGPVENLSELTEAVPQISEDVKMMERNTERLINLVNQILDFRQTEAKGFSLDFTYVNLNELIRDIYLNFEPLAKKKKLAYSIDIPSAAVHTMADEEALQKIFNNLLSNAVKYADKKVVAQLLLPQEGDEFVSVVISNDGFIIPQEMHEKVFEPFYRMKENIKQKGTGIGLALARSLVELHKGYIYIDDRYPGMNTFVVSLPLQTEKEMKHTNRKSNSIA
ncbi:MAG: ligand-binding sensor domain-containing protein [Agriterribacter sp.]